MGSTVFIFNLSVDDDWMGACCFCLAGGGGLAGLLLGGGGLASFAGLDRVDDEDDPDEDDKLDTPEDSEAAF